MPRSTDLNVSNCLVCTGFSSKKLVNFLSDKRIYNVKKRFFNYKIEITTTTALKNKFKCFPMYICQRAIVIAEPNLEVLP